MFVRSTRTVGTTFALALVAAVTFGEASADAKVSEPAAASAPKAVAARTEVKKPPPPRARPADNRDAYAHDLYACHPKEDLACTVVHETAKGVVVVTFRPAGAGESRVWSVVNAPAAPGATSGGTIYVVPSAAAQPVSDVRPELKLSANDAPILD
jgi:hypothetical protein